MADIEIGPETEGQGHWAYQVTVFDDGRRREHHVTLSWSDYDLWSRGQHAPQKVIDALFRFLLARESASAIMAKFDCSVVRRYFPQVDDELPGMIG
jgi:hypothetical protein